MASTRHTVTRTLRRIAPLRAALMTAVVYACVTFVFVPIFLLISFYDSQFSLMLSIIMSLAFPLFYGIIGFVGTLIMCGVYNAIARYGGGIEVEVDRHEEPAESQRW